MAVLAVLGLIWGVKAFLYSRAHETTDDAQVDGHVIPVLAKVGGYIDGVNMEENVHLGQGTLAVLIDTAEYKAKVAQAEADYAAAEASSGARGVTGAAFATVQTARNQSAASDAEIVAAKANYDKAKSDLTRLQSLVDKQIVSRQQLDAAQAASDAAEATWLAAQRQSAAGLAGVSNAEAGVRLANARLASAKAALDYSRLQLSYTKILVPATGVVRSKSVEVGQLVQPGQSLFSLVPDTGAFVTANFKETQLDHIRVGQPVDFDVDAYNGATAHGVVQSIAATTGARQALLPPDNATGNFTKVVQRIPVRIRVTQGLGPDRPLRPGMSVTASVRTR
ncbi:MAG TPA: HlyD family secretion protein [Gemmatimonadaceae bacterium]|nr:HlyD family secretion protein [Gemmatimonadaceae bacterium]